MKGHIHQFCASSPAARLTSPGVGHMLASGEVLLGVAANAVSEP
jgi:hypothetical protein